MMTSEQASSIDGWWPHNELQVTVTNHVAPFCYLYLGRVAGSAKISATRAATDVDVDDDDEPL
jgi:hypothetical protein